MKYKNILMIRTRLVMIALAMLFSSIQLLLVSDIALSQSPDELRRRTQQLQQEIEQNDRRVAELAETAQSLQNKLDQLQIEINQASLQIELTSLKITELTNELDRATNELERQKGLLRTSVRQLYKGRGASALELLVGSESFSQYFNEQTYLETLKNGITESAKQVQELKKQITDQKLEQEELLAAQEVQRRVLDERKGEQQSILNQTQGDQSRYEELLASKREELAQAERDLRDLLERLAREAAGGNLVSYGYVLAGEKVGSVGSTGFSTGPHLHFAVYTNGEFINPRAGGNQLVYNLVWPLPTRGWGAVTQEFGCVAPYNWYLTKCANGRSLHSGLDIGAWYGEPVIASADGNIVYRGWLGGYGFTVIIDHGNGMLTYYPHMLAE